MNPIYRVYYHLLNVFTSKDDKSIIFIPHENCRYDGYDMLNSESDNVLCLFNEVIKDKRFDEYQVVIVYYHQERLDSYIEYCKPFNPKRITFIYDKDRKSFLKSFASCKYVFIDNSIQKYLKVKTQTVVCLNYFAGLIKNEFFKWETRGGYKRMLKEQNAMNKSIDYHLSVSDISSKFIALDNCMYYPKFLNLGFPRNDTFFQDHSALKRDLEKLVGLNIKNIITYVPTHRDYENPSKQFYDKEKSSERSIWGAIPEDTLTDLYSMLESTNSLVIAKVHPKQERSLLKDSSNKHILFYSDLVKNIRTSLNPLLAISDFMITDYTTAVYDFLYTGRPIIYYFYDYEEYLNTRGFFINPIQTICAGHIAYDFDQLKKSLEQLINKEDPYAQKRKFVQELFIKDLDGNSSERIKNYFFNI